MDVGAGFGGEEAGEGVWQCFMEGEGGAVAGGGGKVGELGPGCRGAGEGGEEARIGRGAEGTERRYSGLEETFRGEHDRGDDTKRVLFKV